MSEKTPSVFAQVPKEKWLIDAEYYYVIEDGYPVNPGHLLIVSKRQECNDYFDLNPKERRELPEVIRQAREWIEEYYYPDGYNIGINCGESAGQTVFHFHCHVIPRYEGDMKDPRGGVRHCVEGKGGY